PHLTPAVGLLALLLALVLGAGHAALPGHGKTVLAAYLAGTRGRPRDAVAVGATVTLSHTTGVLAVGLLLATGTALAGETMLRWLGLVSGAVVLVVGVGMLVGVLRTRRRPHRAVPAAAAAVVAAAAAAGHHHHGRHHHHHGEGHHDHGHRHGEHHHDDEHHGGRDDDEHHGHDHAHGPGSGGRPGRLGLAGIGLAGGLVPSPSALIVLLSAIGLGRTWFGVLLVLVYGLGMAATLTGAGLLLALTQRWMARRRLARPAVAGRFQALRRLATQVPGLTQIATASLVLVVGLGLATRAAIGVL
ncbi:MAG: hypothetical protein ACM30G_04940, partial [Micromonosporaceae bacterium]